MTICRSVLALPVLVSLSAFAQFDSLATDYAGDRLYFVSRLAQAGTSQPTYGKLFLADRDGIRPVVIYQREWTSTPRDGQENAGYSNYYDMKAVDLARNGGRFSFSAARDCFVSASYCGTRDNPYVFGADGKQFVLQPPLSYEPSFGGTLRLSSNGRWGMGTTPRMTGFSYHYVVDFTTGMRTEIREISTNMAAPHWRSHAIANDGTAVLSFDDLSIMRPTGKVESLAPPFSPGQLPEFRAFRSPDGAAIDASGKVIVWFSDGAFHKIRLDSLQSAQLYFSREQLVFETPIRDSAQNDGRRALFDLSDDGGRITFLVAGTTPQLFAMNTDGTSRRQITNVPEGVTTSTLSGDGNIVWYVTRSGRLVRLNIENGSSREWIGALNVLDIAPLTYLKNPVNVSAGQPITVPAYLAAGQKVSVIGDGKPLPVLAVLNGRVTVQVPWDALGRLTLELRTDSPELWTPPPSELEVAILDPRAFQPDSSSALAFAIHQDFKSVVNEQHPAAPAEIVHFYATGLGPVSPPVQTGEPAPSAPLSVLRNTLVCTGGDVRYAGLAPSTVGYYQISLQLPAQLPQGEATISCRFANDPDTLSRLQFVLPVAP